MSDELYEFRVSPALRAELVCRASGRGERDLAEETFRLALESIQRWGGRYRISPAMRLRAIRAVVDAALQSDASYTEA